VITAKQAQDALKTPVLDPAKVRVVPSGCANSKYPFFCEYVVSKLKENNAFGKTKEERENYIETSGLVIKTSLDEKAQKAAETSIAQHSKPTDDVIGAVTMVEPNTGLVKAMAQSRPYGAKKGQTAYNYNVEKPYPGGCGPRLDQHVLPAALAADRPVPDRHDRQPARHVRRSVAEAAQAGGVVHARLGR